MLQWRDDHQSENLDVRNGAVDIKWFQGGKTNIAYNCLDRWVGRSHLCHSSAYCEHAGGGKPTSPTAAWTGGWPRLWADAACVTALDIVSRQGRGACKQGQGSRVCCQAGSWARRAMQSSGAGSCLPGACAKLRLWDLSLQGCQAPRRARLEAAVQAMHCRWEVQAPPPRQRAAAPSGWQQSRPCLQPLLTSVGWRVRAVRRLACEQHLG